MKDNEYLLSVRLMTYMHAPYIKEAMDGIMMQKTNFKVEVVVGDDFSTDGTLEIIKDYKDTENIHIKILNRQKGDEYWKKRQELGRLYNFVNILENCSGKYIALLDGDDYWTDPLKLQKQVDFLENNEEYILCFTNCSTVDQNSKTLNPKFLSLLDHDKDYKTENLMFVAPTATRVFKNIDLDINFNFYGRELPDALMLIEQLKKGKAKYLNFNSSCYRKHDEGIWSLTTEIEKNTKKFYVRLYAIAHTEGKVKKMFIKDSFIKLLKIYKTDYQRYLCLKKEQFDVLNHNTSSPKIKLIMLFFNFLDYPFLNKNLSLRLKVNLKYIILKI